MTERNDNKFIVLYFHLIYAGLREVFDNIFIERLWRSVKYEEVYLKDYKTAREAESGIRKYFEFYNNEDYINR